MRLRVLAAALVCLGLMGAVCRADSIFTYNIDAIADNGGTLTGDFVVEGTAGQNFLESNLVSFSADYSLGGLDESWDETDFAGGSDTTPDTDLSGVLGDAVLTPQPNEDYFAFVNFDFAVLELGFTDFSNDFAVPPDTNWLFGFVETGPLDGGTWQLDLASETSAAPLPGSLATGIIGMAALAVFGLRRAARAKIA